MENYKKKHEKATSQSYFYSSFPYDKHRLEKNLLCVKSTINTKLRVSQYKILNNVLYLNKMLFRFGKVKSPLYSFCKSSEAAAVHLFSRCSFSQIFGPKLQYSFRIILLSLIFRHRVPFLILWKKFKINVI